MKKISVVIPYFNSEKYFPETLSSIVSQSYPDIEIVIVDDKSNPSSVLALEKIVKDLKKDRQVQIIHHEKNVGVAESRNTGLRAATGQYILFLDADDIICGKYSLEFRADFLNTHSEFDATGGYSIKIDSHSSVLINQTKPTETFARAVQHPDTVLSEYCEYSLHHSENTVKVFFLITGSCLLVKESIKNLFFDSHFDSEDDVEWTLRFLQAGKKIKLHKVPFHFWRIHPEQYHLKTPKQLTQNLLNDMQKIKTALTPSSSHE
ncbi:MAG: glycosyltransferase [Patescibacteria group bacterium]